MASNKALRSDAGASGSCSLFSFSIAISFKAQRTCAGELGVR